MSNYDYTPNVWSPTGQIQQAKNATECVKNSPTSIILPSEKGIHILVRKIKNPLRILETKQKIQLFPTFGIVYTGYPSDIYFLQNRVLTENMFQQTDYKEGLSAGAVTYLLRETLYANTRSNLRLFGCVIHIFDTETLSAGYVYFIDVEGAVSKVKADVTGYQQELYKNNLLNCVSISNSYSNELLYSGTGTSYLDFEHFKIIEVNGLLQFVDE